MEDGEQKTCLQHFSEIGSDSIRPTFSFRIEHEESFHLLDFTFSFLAKREEIVTHGCRHPFFSMFNSLYEPDVDLTFFLNPLIFPVTLSL